MSNYDAERYSISGKWYRYQTVVFYKVHKVIANFKHRTALGGYVGTILRVKWHTLNRRKPMVKQSDSTLKSKDGL